MGGFLLQATNFIKFIGTIVSDLIEMTPIATFFSTVMTVFFTVKLIGVLRYRENGG